MLLQYIVFGNCEKKTHLKFNHKEESIKLFAIFYIILSVADPNTKNLDPNPGFWLKLDPDPGLYYKF